MIHVLKSGPQRGYTQGEHHVKDTQIEALRDMGEDATYKPTRKEGDKAS